MGVASSSIGWDDGEGLGELPESCVALVLVYLDPPEICGLAKLSRLFRAAASADFVWELKLPPNYLYLLEKSISAEKGEDLEKLMKMSKKEIYALLCQPNPFDGGTKMFWLEKRKGGLCLSISSKALSITGIDDRRYWNFIPTEESRFHSVAYLQQIWWFEVGGFIEFCFPPNTYSLFYRVHLGRSYKRLGRRYCNMEHTHGWSVKPVRFQLSTSDGQGALTEYILNGSSNWIYYHVGDFIVESCELLTKVEFTMRQIDCTHTKGGLTVDSVLICPTDSRPQNVFRNHT